jgi:hypothetical protein
MKFGLLTIFVLLNLFIKAQNEDEEDYSSFEVAGEKTKTFANAKINGLSPQRFATIAWDYQLPYLMQLSSIGSFGVDSTAAFSEEADVQYTGGIRINTNIPIISKNSFIWQGGINYWQTDYVFSNTRHAANSSRLTDQLASESLRNLNASSTIYKPLNAEHFIIVQLQADLSGNYSFNNIQSLEYLRYSAAAIWGKRPNDRKQWGLGISRTYRVGAFNYIPILLFNYTSVSQKWGTEILFPARAALRYKLASNKLLLAGYELEGQSYRIQQFSMMGNSFEIRRGELRPRLEYQQQLVGFFWLNVQAGLRIDWSFDADQLPEGKDFFRGFFGEQNFAMRNQIGPTPYFNIGISFVSP